MAYRGDRRGCGLVKVIRAVAIIASMMVGCPVFAQAIEPAPGAQPYKDGVWAIAGWQAPLDERNSYVAVFAARIGGQDSEAILFQAQKGFKGGIGVFVDYGYSLSGGETGAQLRSHTGRVGVSWVGDAGKAEFDGRLSGEVIAPEGLRSIERGRARLRATLPLVRASKERRLRVFAGDELLFEQRGITRNRFSAGLRGQADRLSVDIYWQREDRDDGRGIDALVLQTILQIGGK